MGTQVELCNAALGLLGEFVIGNIDEDSDAAQQCKRWFDLTLDESLRKHRWNSVSTRGNLAKVATFTSDEWANAFQLPTNFLRILQVNQGLSFNQYQREQDKILTNDERVNLKYVFRPDSVARLDPLCAMVFYYDLAIKMAMPLTDDYRTVRKDLKEEMRTEIFMTAAYVDATEEEVEIPQDSQWQNSRFNSTNG